MQEIVRCPNRSFQAAVARASFTYNQLAEKAGVSKSTVVRVANGEDCHYGTAIKLADALGKTPEELKIV